MKLVLGTAQFGLDYGITNTRGKVARQEVYQILEEAKSYGVTTLDTAIAYGDSEQVLGDCCAEINGFDFISKLTIDSDHSCSVLEEIEGSCCRLKVNELYAVMVHNAEALLENNGSTYWADLEKAKSAGRVKKIGVSVYTPEHAKKIIENYNIDIIQIPFNLLDQRFKRSGLLKIFKQRNIEVHARSIFLQGLLLSDYTNLHEYFQPIQSKLSLIDKVCAENNTSKLDLVFSQLNAIKEIDAVVFGVTSSEELGGIFKAKSHNTIIDIGSFSFDYLSAANEQVINPSCWPNKIRLLGANVD